MPPYQVGDGHGMRGLYQESRCALQRFRVGLRWGWRRIALRIGKHWWDVHGLFLANFFAQTKALAFGKTADEVRAEGTAEAIVPARVFTGNRPTTSIMAPELTPSVLGQLVALYEHITFTEGAVWGIDSFDQWGVELGKQLPQQLGPAIAGDEAALAAQDASTRALITYYRSHRIS